MGWLQKLKQGLSKSSQKVSDSLKSLTSLSSLMGASKLDAASIEEVEDALIGADLGTKSAARLAEAMRKHKFDGPVTSDSLAAALADSIAEILRPVTTPLVLDSEHRPHVLLLVGVNGSGKTTTAGKLAQQWHQQDKTVMLAAGDTFRAAAVEQLQSWGQREDIPVIAQAQGSDSASVAFDAVQSAQARGVDVLLVDTAGRLQAKSQLMDELAKIQRVVKRLDEHAPHEVILVLDGGVGQNALSQVKLFNESIPLTGLVVTKLDGTAKAGVLFALASQSFGTQRIPVRFIGVGEGIEDLRTFEAEAFVSALLQAEEPA